MAITAYFKNVVAGNVFYTQLSPALPTAYYIGLSTTDPATTLTEPSSSAGYTRRQLTGLSAPSGGVVTNQSAINFPESTANWGTITHYFISDSGTVGEGNILFTGTITPSRTAETGTTFYIPSGALTLSVEDVT